MPASQTMLDCLATARENGGKLVRRPGGFWTYEGCAERSAGVPSVYFSFGTVRGLISREQMDVTEWGPGRHGGRYPVAAAVREQAA